MKILSVRQPWCWLLFNGKDIENRTWNTSYRGPLLIHASLGTDPENFMPKQREWIEESGIVIPDDNDLPRGAIVGSVTLTDVYSDGRDENLLDIYDLEYLGKGVSRWFEGPYGFKMEDAVEFAEPIQWRGQLGIRDYTGPVLDINGLI